MDDDASVDREKEIHTELWMNERNKGMDLCLFRRTPSAWTTECITDGPE